MPLQNIQTQNKSDHIEKRSELVHEIVSSKPGFLVSHGTGIFFCILLLVIAATWFIRFPDTITGHARFTSLNAPKLVITKTEGRLIKLFVHENEHLKSGEIIGYMESTASHEDVLNIDKKLTDLEKLIIDNNFSQLNLSNKSYSASLGELQPGFENMEQATLEFKNYVGSGYFIQKHHMLENDLKYISKMSRILSQQKEMNNEDLDLSTQNFEANKKLNHQKVIADVEFRNEKSKLIGKQLSIPQINAALINNETQRNEKLKEIAQLEKDISEQKDKFIRAIRSYRSEILVWKNKYLLTAPISGNVSLTGFLQENQQLRSNFPVCYIDPGNSSYYAEMNIPQSNFGKIKTGQQVLLKLPSYPFEEYGALKGELEFVSNIPSDSGYLSKIKLPVGLITLHNKKIHFREGLQARAEIITRDTRLLQRMYYSIVKQIE